MSFNYLYHSNVLCFFKDRPHRFIRSLLTDFQYLSQVVHTHGFCTCFEFAWIRANPKYINLELEEHEFIDIAINAGFLFKEKLTKYTYTLGKHEGMVFIDRNVGSLMEEFFPQHYKDAFEYTKTPKEGRMYFALLGYLYPEVKYNINERFRICYELAVDYVFSNLEVVKPATLTQIIDEIPKTTSAGFIGIRETGGRRKKEDILDLVVHEYKKMKSNAINGIESENYVMFAQRGHLSKKNQLKTRPIWMQSAETVVAELRFARNIYSQLDNSFFRSKVIHGNGSMKRLGSYLRSNPDFHFTNTDISGWDAFRAVFHHRRFYSELKNKLDLDYADSKLYDYICFQSNVYARVLFPCGASFKTNGGLMSGSGFTLLQNTLLNMIATYTVLNMMGIDKYDYVAISWLGDDFSIVTRDTFDLETYSRLLLKYFGLEVKPEKCVVCRPFEDRKFLGYEVKGGFLTKNETDLFAGILYTEHYFKVDETSIAKSFTRLFSYLILGGFSSYEFVEFFYLFMGKYGTWLDKVEYIFDDRSSRMTRVLKDIYNVNISKFNSDSFKKMSLTLCKYILLYDYDLLDVNKLVTL